MRGILPGEIHAALAEIGLFGQPAGREVFLKRAVRKGVLPLLPTGPLPEQETGALLDVFQREIGLSGIIVEKRPQPGEQFALANIGHAVLTGVLHAAGVRIWSLRGRGKA